MTFLVALFSKRITLHKTTRTGSQISTFRQSKLNAKVLGQERSHATGQSHGQSQTTQSDEPTNCPKPTKTQVGLMTKQSTNPPNVHTVMTPMPQPVGSWHVTSMTGQMNSTMSHNKLHDQTHKTID